MSSTKNFENLANAIILQAVRDYRTALKCLKLNPNNRNALSDKEEIERFFRSKWYSTLTSVDGEMLIRSLISSMSGDGELMLSILASFAQEESRSISENVKWGTRKRFEQGIPNGRFQIYGYRWDGDHLVVEPEEAKIVRLIYDNFLNGLSAETTCFTTHKKQKDKENAKK